MTVTITVEHGIYSDCHCCSKVSLGINLDVLFAPKQFISLFDHVRKVTIHTALANQTSRIPTASSLLHRCCCNAEQRIALSGIYDDLPAGSKETLGEADIIHLA